MDEPHVRVSLSTIYEKLLEVSSKVDLVQSTQTQLDRLQADTESRLRRLERRLFPLGSIASLVAIASLGFAILSR